MYLLCVEVFLCIVIEVTLCSSYYYTLILQKKKVWAREDKEKEVGITCPYSHNLHVEKALIQKQVAWPSEPRHSATETL